MITRLADVKAGDIVLQRSRNRRSDPSGEGRRVRVARVGPKNIYIEGDNVGYSRSDRCRKDAFGHEWLQTRDEREEEKGRDTAVERLKTHGVLIMLRNSMSTAQVLKLADAVDEIVKEG